MNELLYEREEEIISALKRKLTIEVEKNQNSERPAVKSQDEEGTVSGVWMRLVDRCAHCAAGKKD